MDEQEIPDAALVTLARSGDKNAFGRLVERYQQMARHVARCMVPDDDIARELTQEAMLQAYLSLSHLRDDATFKSWRQATTFRRQPTPEEMDRFHKTQEELVTFVFGAEA